ncbi:unnamed protein product [Brugia timori]|uniref:Lipoprotein n=1 Tax=Brugia timori TaxID=42155 RepID=A0A0R3Q610_9BILA|nr:unnamed protein product [Brugia timori]
MPVKSCNFFQFSYLEVRWNMRQHLWLCFVLAGLLLAACAAHDEDDSNNDLGGKNVIDEEEKSAK